MISKPLANKISIWFFLTHKLVLWARNMLNFNAKLVSIRWRNEHGACKVIYSCFLPKNWRMKLDFFKNFGTLNNFWAKDRGIMSHFLVQKSPRLILFQFHHIHNFETPCIGWSKTEIEIGEWKYQNGSFRQLKNLITR